MLLIYDALRDDHRQIKALLEHLVSIDESSHETRDTLLGQIHDMLIPHSKAEEAVFYNSLRSLNSAKEIIFNSYEEHIEAENLLRFLRLQSKIEGKWKASAYKLKEILEEHIHEEELRIFPVAQLLFTTEEAQMMTGAFERLKSEVRDQGMVQSAIDMVATIMPTRFAASMRTHHLNPHG